MPFTPEELEEMRIADEEIERDFKHGRIKADPLADKYADPERFKHNARCLEYYRNNRERLNAKQRERRAKAKAENPEKEREYRRQYRARIKETYRSDNCA